jgi:hypothetical protein
MLPIPTLFYCLHVYSLMKLVATMKPVTCVLNVCVGTLSTALVITTAMKMYFVDATFTDLLAGKDPRKDVIQDVIQYLKTYDY